MRPQINDVIAISQRDTTFGRVRGDDDLEEPFFRRLEGLELFLVGDLGMHGY
jgi:hypothetical protein